MFAKLTAVANLYKRAPATLCRTVLLSTLGGWVVLQLPNLSAIANEPPSAQSVETFKSSNAVSSVICITACNEFFEGGRASFESEIRNLQSRAARQESEVPLLQIDPSLVKTLETYRETESR